ncbi:MAG TPA: proton-conducting transporter membrane subunit [Candidatus Saccharicenans sp.]|jgi:formate hydrogenlyase subunit 3/multisubunit Na+/H+ antiporter MnhD subunit|nr:hypothetical protein [Candidatus Saccharicenans sp.]HRD02792.1 proton-conducting transporter membrane subunit [Candidatus Saccharicenans sp.]
MAIMSAFWLTLLLTALMALVFRKKTNFIRLVGTFLIALSCLLLIFLSLSVLGKAGLPFEFEIKAGSFHLPFLIDGLSALFLLLLSVLTLASVIFSLDFVKKYQAEQLWKFYLALPLFIGGLGGLLTVDDLGLGFTLAWQLMVISSYLLVRWGRPVKVSARPALVYLIFMEVAWLMITGSAFLAEGYQFGDSLATIGLKLAQGSQWQGLIFFSLLFLGFGIKTGVFPFGQFWIPGAYSTAWPQVSSMLAGILEKTGVFGLIRVFFFVSKGSGAAFNPDLWGKTLVVAGTLTLFVGTVQAIKQSDYLRLLAYSSIGQVGYIIFALGSSLLAWNSSWPLAKSLAGVIFIGAVYHSLNHGIFKSLLFLLGGNLLYATGTRDLNRLGGLLAVMPVSGFLAALASYSISGMPASSGFVSKWLMISSNFLAGRDSLLLTLAGIVALFTAAFTLACYVKFFGLAFTSAGARWKVKSEIKEVPWRLLASEIFLTVICLTQAFLPMGYVKLISRSLGLSTGFLIPEAGAEILSGSMFSLKIYDGQSLLAATAPAFVLLLIILLALLAYWFSRSARTAEVKVPAWLAGYQDLNQNNVYADRHVFSDLKKFFWWTGGSPKKIIDDDELANFPEPKEKGGKE